MIYTNRPVHSRGMHGNGYILAGGLSKRMGREKALMVWRGQPLIERVSGLLSSLDLEVHVVLGSSMQARRYEVSTVIDILPDCGPMGGILSGLRHSKKELNCFVPCDMPMLTKGLLRSLEDQIKDYDAIVPRDTSGRVQPLVGYYSPRCIDILAKWVGAGRLSLTGLIKSGEMRVKILENAAGNPEEDIFLNINDLQSFRKTQS